MEFDNVLRWPHLTQAPAPSGPGVDIDKVHERYQPDSVIPGPWQAKENADLADRVALALSLCGLLPELKLTVRALPGGAVLIERKQAAHPPFPEAPYP